MLGFFMSVDQGFSIDQKKCHQSEMAFFEI